MTLLTSENRAQLHHYKYKGGDTSPIYGKILSPFAQFWVDTVTPSWLAPNAITLGGLMFSVLSIILTLIYNPSLGLGAPRWMHLLTGVNLFIYQTMDNMDGKQVLSSAFYIRILYQY